jgi:2-dehydro-3-deoxyphosphooctonate aldolase (KDO 8-P synthase)
MYGYYDLVVDYRSIVEMQKTGYPVMLDITHSLQQPNLPGGISGGRPELIETIAKAGIAVGVDGIFIETHPNPAEALSDGANMLRLDLLEPLLEKLVMLRQVVNQFEK